MSYSRGTWEMRDQLCLHCAKYVDGCVWARSKGNVPVPGWDAVPVYNKYGMQWTWHINDCPEFDEDPKYPRGQK